MASTSSSNGNITKTQSQEETQKRSAEEETNQNVELKRQKNMFAPRKVVGPHDILVNSNLPKIKLEEDVGCSPAVKLEPLEIEPPSTDASQSMNLNSTDSQADLEADESIVVKVEDTFDVESASTEPFAERVVQNEQNSSHDNMMDVDVEMPYSDVHKSNSSLEIPLKLEDDGFQQNHIKALTRLIEQKDQEIKALFEVFKGLQLRLNDKETILSETGLENEQFALIDSNINKGSVIKGNASEASRVVANLTSDLMERHAKIRILSMKILKLQDKLFGTASFKLEVSKNYKILRDFVQESFKLIFPFLYTYLQLNDILKCRMVCPIWRDVTDNFLRTHPSVMPFNKETHLREKRKLELDPMPKWDESPLQKLAKAYVFSYLEALKKFRDDYRRTIIGSKICLDNLNLTKKQNPVQAGGFLKRFGVHIEHLIIRWRVELPDFKSHLLMDHIKFCLSKLTNLRYFKLVLTIDREKIKWENGRFVLPELKNKTCNHWVPNTFPKLEKLESLELTLENWEGFSEKANFLENFSVNLVKPYSAQLKRLSIFTPGFDPSDISVFPNLVELSLPREKMGGMKFICQHVEKCTITSHSEMLFSDWFFEIPKQFPKLTNLGFKLEKVGFPLYDVTQIYFRSWRPEDFPRLPNILTLELENCDSITFNLLNCFPNLNYIKIIHKYNTNNMTLYDYDSDMYSSDIDDDSEDRLRSRWVKDKKFAFKIANLLKDMNFYKYSQFWERFPNISLVSLEFSDEQIRNSKRKLYRWTRNGYTKYSKTNTPE